MFLQHHLSLPLDAVHVHAAYAGEVASHAYIKQKINNLTIANAVANIAFNKDNQVVAFGSSFVENGEWSLHDYLSRLLTLVQRKRHLRYPLLTYILPLLRLKVFSEGDSIALRTQPHHWNIS